MCMQLSDRLGLKVFSLMSQISLVCFVINLLVSMMSLIKIGIVFKYSFCPGKGQREKGEGEGCQREGKEGH